MTDTIVESDDKIEYTRRGRFHRTDGPAFTVFGRDGNNNILTVSEEWYLNGKRTTIDKEQPAVVRLNEEEEVVLEQWWSNDKLTRENNPAVISRRIRRVEDVDLVEVTQEWFTNGKRNNTSGPAIITTNENDVVVNEQWWIDGKLSRVDGPAIKRLTNESTNKEWLLNRTRLDSTDPLPPPVEIIRVPTDPTGPPPLPDYLELFEDVTIEEWWLNGVRHRLDGPAIVITNSSEKVIREECWVDGKRNGAIIKPSSAWVNLIEINGSSVVTKRVEIPIQDYKTENALLNALITALNAVTTKIFSYQRDFETNIVTFSYAGTGDVEFEFSEDPLESLSYILGFSVDETFTYAFVNNTLSAPGEMVFEPLPAVKVFEGLDVDGKSIYTLEYWTNGLKSRFGGPAIIQFVNTPPDENKRLARLFNYFWYEDGIPTRVDGPAVILSNGTEEWYLDGILTRENGPAVKQFLYKENGISRFDEYWYTDGKLNREDDEPAVERANGDKEWYLNDVRTRTDAPAIIKSDGSEYWYKNGVLDRDDDEPAVLEYVDTIEDGVSEPIILFNKYWYTNGNLNRGGGEAAVENADGSREWYTNGKLNRGGDEPAVTRTNGDEEWWTNGELTREGKAAIIYGDGREVWITARPIGTNLLVTEPKDIPLSESFVRDLLPSLYVNNIDMEEISSVRVLRDIFATYGTIVDITYASTYGFITYSSPLAAQAAIDGENGKVYGASAISVSDIVTSITKNGRTFTIELEIIPRASLSVIVTKIIGEVGLSTRTDKNIIFITEPKRIVYPQTIIEDLFSTYPEWNPSVSKTDRTFTITLTRPPGSLLVRDIYNEVIVQNLQDISVIVKTAQNGQTFRDVEPAITTNDSSIWMIDGKIGRAGGEPAIEFKNGDNHWYLEGELHREGDLPAIKKANCDEEWFLRGKRSRVGAPAIVLANGSEEWWINGSQRRDGDLPSIKRFVKFIGEEILWLKSFPYPKFKGALKRSIIGNGKSVGQIVWETETYEEGRYYYISQKNTLNQGTIWLVTAGDEPVDRIFDVTISSNGKFQFDGLDLEGNVLSEENPTISLKVGDRLILNVNLKESAYDHIWSTDGVIGRPVDEPSILRWNGDKEWYFNGKLGRPGDKHAIERVNGDREWYINGILGRAGDGPTIERANGDREWYINGRRGRASGGPAIERANGDREWYTNGFRNRFDGPAIIRSDGTEIYYICGIKTTDQGIFDLINLYDDFCLPMVPETEPEDLEEEYED